MQFQEKANNRSAFLKAAFAAAVALCIIIALALLVGLGLYRTRIGLAQPPEPGASIPAITVEPASGLTGTPVTIHGQGWSQDSTILIYIVTPAETVLPGFAIAGATTDSEGRFTVTFSLPAEPRWEEADLVKIIARASDSNTTTQAFFRLTDAPVASGGTPLTPDEPIDTLPAAPAATATAVVQQPTPEPDVPLAMATTYVNIRSGSGLHYPVLGVLRAGQNAEVIGISPDGSWWQIKFADGQGWVSAQFVTIQQVADIPIIQPSAPPPAATPAPVPITITEWRGEYYDNPNLDGSPVLIRNDQAARFGWGPDSPGPGVPADNFSVRWTRDLYFSAGIYQFKLLADDGARLWIDNQLILDHWRIGPPKTFRAEEALTEGTHHVRLEYFDYIYDAQLNLKWEPVDEASISELDWKAEYFDNPNLEGVPVLVQNEAEIDHNWSAGSSTSGVPVDNFSARWTRQIDVPAGVYVARITANGGVRVWVDEVLVIDSWHDSETRVLTFEGYIVEGQHWLRVEYYERSGNAQVKAEWYKKE